MVPRPPSPSALFNQTLSPSPRGSSFWACASNFGRRRIGIKIKYPKKLPGKVNVLTKFLSFFSLEKSRSAKIGEIVYVDVFLLQISIGLYIGDKFFAKNQNFF
jgi:hypothetical protein